MSKQAVKQLMMSQFLLACLLSTSAVSAQARPTERVSPPPQCNPDAVVWRTPEPPAEPQKGDVWVNPIDGMEMVYIAPGESIMGTSDAEIDAWLKEHPEQKREWFADEQPQFRVNLPGYWVSRTEVTNAQYLRFVQATGHRSPDHWKDARVPSGLDDYPVVFVYWQDARAYCEWAGGRLPTEPEWEKAARGGDGRTFPWGFRWDESRCRLFQRSDDPITAAEPGGTNKGPASVASYPSGASPYGCLDMAGNVWEWCADRSARDAYEPYARGDMTPPTQGTRRVLRGGSWGPTDLLWLLRCARRQSWEIEHHGDCIGFRYAVDAARGAQATSPGR